MVPKEKRSARGSAGFPSMVSGARCAGDPRMLPVTVNFSSGSSSAAMPKSVSFTTPSSRTMMFSGLRSRWTTPAACACCSASAIGSRHAAANSGGIEGVRLGELPQRLAADELGDEVARLRRRAGEVVDVEDERVVQARDRVRLAVEAAADVLARVEVRVQDLDGHDAAQLRVPAAPDHGHPALAHLFVEAVPPSSKRILRATPMSRPQAPLAAGGYSKARQFWQEPWPAPPETPGSTRSSSSGPESAQAPGIPSDWRSSRSKTQRL